MNEKIAETQTANAQLTTENATLAGYIDSLMARVASMGGLITSNRSSPSLRARFLSGRRGRAVRG